MSESREKRETADAVRTFICIEIPESIKERIAELQRGLRRADAQVSWTKPSNIHLTLKFLGDVTRSRIERVSRAVERAASSSLPFEIEVGPTGCFPSPRSPRVLWIGLTGLPGSLKQLHECIEDELFREGFPREAKRFSPHLTIGRVRAPKNASRLAEELLATGFEPETFQAHEVIVMRSELKPTGSVYTPQAAITLGHSS
jgi:RNA 2',3'-cyclic 3'-phosphodiesterase